MDSAGKEYPINIIVLPVVEAPLLVFSTMPLPETHPGPTLRIILSDIKHISTVQVTDAILLQMESLTL